MRVLILSLLILGGLPEIALAHTNTEGYSNIRSSGEALSYGLDLDYSTLIDAAELDVPAGEVSPAEAMIALRENRAELSSYLDPRLTVSTDGNACSGSLVGMAVQRNAGRNRAMIDLTFACKRSTSIRTYQIDYDVLFDADAQHRNVANYKLVEEEGQFVFTAEERRLDVGADATPGSMPQFLLLGFEHILAGIDHVLFIVALLLCSRTLKGVLKVVTVFTLAHSMTLTLVALRWVQVPVSIVEPLIALSIAFVGFEAIFGSRSEPRMVVVFAFGLLHGMGFAEVLDIGRDGVWRTLLSLFSFNVGIELGQALIVILLFPCLLVIRQFAWSRMVEAGAASLITLLGVAWFFDRLPL